MKYTLLEVNTKNDENTYIEISLIDENNKIIHLEDREYKPYFYIMVENENSNILKEQNIQDAGFEYDNIQLKKFLNIDKKYPMKKIIFNNTKDMQEFIKNNKNNKDIIATINDDIPLDLNYIVDKNITPMMKYEIDDKFNYKEICEKLEYKKCAIDIETYVEDNLENAKIILVSIYSEDFKKVITYKKPKKSEKYLKLVKDEKELIEELLDTIKDTHILITYGGDNFDLPHLKRRAQTLGIIDKFEKILEFKTQNKGGMQSITPRGIQHIDGYKIIQNLSRIGAIDIERYKLNDVYNYLFGKQKIDIKYHEINEYYNDEQKLTKLIEYNLVDSIAAYEIVNIYLMQYIKLAMLTKKSLQDAIRVGSSNLIESMLIFKSKHMNRIIPKKPDENLVNIRDRQTFEGGFVKEPKTGLHEKIAVLDFQSFHPSIIITFNISKESHNVETKNINESPIGDKFSSDYPAIIPKITKEILDTRIKIKNEMKNVKKNSEEYSKLYAEQWSLKILINSIFGYQSYSRARWYCFECARSILKYTHKYIKEVIENANKNNLEVIYSDTDSAFVKFKEKKDVEEFVKKINETLPGYLKLSLEEYYKKGLFVSKKQGIGSAKKKYALLNYDNEIKIIGFEVVRRDWSEIARNTQKKLIDTLLKTGDEKKAIQDIKEVIHYLESNKAKLSELIIMSKIRKNLNDYDSIGPHISAAKKANELGYNFKIGDNIDYIVTENGDTISKKAQIYEIAKNYDAKYYIENQIIPVTIAILAEFGYTKEDILEKTKQKTLFG